MKLALAILLGLVAVIVAAIGFGLRHLRRAARSQAGRDVVQFLESLDEGLAIPMRDADTRRKPN